jgi:Fe2+ or Zn2+ uptake regulation protein
MPVNVVSTNQLLAYNENQGTVNLHHFHLVCEKQIEVLRFVHFVIKLATIYDPR